MSYQFSQVGNDKKGECLDDAVPYLWDYIAVGRCDHHAGLGADNSTAQQFLSSLDDHPQIGSLIDQTMDYEYEQEQMKQKTGEDLSPEMWIMKWVSCYQCNPLGHSTLTPH